MIGQLGIILMTFKETFPRDATFRWFVVVVFGFIIRLDHHGVSSSIRWLGVRSDLYETFLVFFRSGAVKLEKVMRHWQVLVTDRLGTTSALLGFWLAVRRSFSAFPFLMGKLLTTVASNIGKRCVAVLDAYFAASPIFAMVKALRGKDGERLLRIITRARSNVVAREQHPAAYCGRGRPPKYENKIWLTKLFTSMSEDFSNIAVSVYGETIVLVI